MTVELCMCVIEIIIVFKCFRLRFTLYKFLILFHDSHELCVHVRSSCEHTDTPYNSHHLYTPQSSTLRNSLIMYLGIDPLPCVGGYHMSCGSIVAHPL